jgi:hypothetical protein
MDARREAVRAADELAALLGDQRGTRTLLALQQFMAVSAEAAQAAAGSTATPAAGPAPAAGTGPAAGSGPTRRRGRPRSAGVWDLSDTPQGVALTRRPNTPLWESCVWSGDEHQPGKGDASRVVLIGESVARGYLLDPVFNPTMALRHHLDTISPGRYQCVDLARTSMRLAALRGMVRLAPALQTDVLVVLAGNNWIDIPDELPKDRFPGLARTLHAEGYRGLRDTVLRESTLPQVEALLSDLVRLRSRHGVRPVVVIPEFNLSGWSPLGVGKEMEVPMLPEDALVRWQQLRGKALAARADANWPAVITAARAMLDLDEGTSPIPGYLLGKALEATGDPAGARAAYEQSRDSVCGQLAMYLPRICRPIQDLLRDVCGRQGVDVVDLPGLLGAGRAGGPPDPDDFLDYCHLSDSGVTTAMAETARVITGERSYAGSQPPVTSWDRAVSQVLAAAYNSFCGQPNEVVGGYLRRALEADPEVVGLMRAFATVLDRPGGPLWTGDGFDEVIRQPSVASIFERLGEYRPGKTRVWSLRESLAEALGTTLTTEQAVAAGDEERPEELLDIASTLLGLGAVANYTEARCYLQANTPGTEIRFELAEPTAGVVRLVHRRREGDGEVPVRLNGLPLGSLPGEPVWRTTEFVVPVEATRTGLNVIALDWPGPSVSMATRLAEDVDALYRAEPPYVLPIFGELFSAVFDRRPVPVPDMPDVPVPVVA